MLSHNNIMANAVNMHPLAHVQDTSRYAHIAPMFHVADNAMTFLVTANGAPTISCLGSSRWRPCAWWSRARITHLLIVPTMVNMMVNHPDVMNHDLSCGTGCCSAPRRCRTPCCIMRAAGIMPGTRLVHLYGQVGGRRADPPGSIHGIACSKAQTPAVPQMRPGRGGLGCEVRVTRR